MKYLYLYITLTLFGSCGDGPIIDLLPDSSENLVFPQETSQYVHGSYIVTFKDQAQPVLNLGKGFFSESKFYHHNLMSNYIEDHRVQDINYISAIDVMPKPKAEEKSLWEHIPMPRSLMSLTGANYLESPKGVIARVDFSSEDEAKEVLKEWNDEGRIWFAEPNWVSKLTGTFDDLNTAYTGVDHHWIKSMEITEGFKHIADQIAAGTLVEETVLANAPVVAVMDSGVDYEHPAFEGRIWENESPGESDCVEDVYGCDLTFKEKGYLGRGTTIHPFGIAGPNTPCPQGQGDEGKLASNCLHGTHVAGIVAGRIDQGVPGTCPICKIMVLKVVGDDLVKTGSVSDDAILKGMKYVTRFVKDESNAVRIINASISKFQRSRNVALLVNQLKNNSNGTLLVGAAGNEDTSFRAYPAALTDAIAVSSIQSDFKKASYSNFGIWVDVAAPGGGASGGAIISAAPGGETKGSQGTSMASPMVAGIAGMILAVEPNLSIGDLRSRIINTADGIIYDVDKTEGFNQNYYKYISVDNINVPLLGSGLVSLLAALTNEQQGINITEFVNTRVQSGCSVIGDVKQSYVSLILFLLLPMLVAVFYRK